MQWWRLRREMASTANATTPKSTKSKNSKSLVQIQIKPTSQFEFVTSAARYWGIWVSGNGRFRGCNDFCGNCQIHWHLSDFNHVWFSPRKRPMILSVLLVDTHFELTLFMFFGKRHERPMQGLNPAPHTHTHTQSNNRTHIYTHTHLHAHTYTYTHTHTIVLYNPEHHRGLYPRAYEVREIAGGFRQTSPITLVYIYIYIYIYIYTYIHTCMYIGKFVSLTASPLCKAAIHSRSFDPRLSRLSCISSTNLKGSVFMTGEHGGGRSHDEVTWQDVWMPSRFFSVYPCKIYICIYVYVYIYIDLYTNIHIFIYNICIFVCMYMHIFVHI